MILICETNRMGKHYHLDISVDAHTVKTIKEEFNNYLNETAGFAIYMEPIDSDDAPPSEELQKAINELFNRLIVTIEAGNFQRIN